MSIYTAGASVGAIDDWQGWLWPVPIWNDRDPTISDGFQRAKSAEHRSHLGADIMFRRLPSEPAKLPNASKHFAIPDGVPALAVGPGTIRDFGLTGRNHFVMIDHGKVNGHRMVTFYQHLSRLAPGLVKGASVGPGAYLGDVGGDLPPHYTLKHLHFEVWYTDRGIGRKQWAVDPAPLLKRWSKVSIRGMALPTIVPSNASPESRSRVGAAGAVIGGSLAALAGYAALSRKRGGMV